MDPGGAEYVLWSPTVGTPMKYLVVLHQTAIRPEAKCRMIYDTNYRAAIVGTPRPLARGTVWAAPES